MYTIRHIIILNTTGGAITLKLGINGVADANLILPSASIDAGGFAEFTGLEILTGVETLRAVASGNGLTITASGLDQS